MGFLRTRRKERVRHFVVASSERVIMRNFNTLGKPPPFIIEEKKRTKKEQLQTIGKRVMLICIYRKELWNETLRLSILLVSQKGIT